MRLSLLDWGIIAFYFAATLAIGLWSGRGAGKNTSEYFLSGRSMPWWLLGTSMVATTFSTDTPNLVTDIVRQNGVAGNWAWWAFLLTGMLTVFVYAKLWRRAEILTDLEFYEIRYSGRPAAFLRGFRAIYLGVFFNIMIMASVTLAAIKIGGVLMGISPLWTVLLAGGITLIFSMTGGLKSVLITDFFLFFTAMAGSIAAAVVALRHPDVGGLSRLLTNPAVSERLSILPDLSDPAEVIPILVIPLAVQWWSVWYPGSEPGGGGYIAQRMLSAKDEKEATASTLFFNAAHYSLRPWPWIIVALCSLVVFPTIESIRVAFPNVSPSILGHDLAYPAMLTFLPAGLLGLVIASLAAAYMSTICTHLNWGASYVVNDFWRRFVDPAASERRLVFVGRIATAVLMVLSAALALWLQNAYQAFTILLQIGAGTGLLFILRWFWWRINAASELAAMAVSFLVAVYLELFHGRLFPNLPLSSSAKLLWGVGLTTVAWVTVSLVTRPTDPAVLRRFYRLVRPGGPGWERVVAEARREGDALPDPGEGWTVPQGLLATLVGSVTIYAALFGIGYWLYGRYTLSAVFIITAVVGAVYVLRQWGELSGSPAAISPETDRRVGG
ncbi:MAG: Na+:solute symporter [Gemmatimonadetes bacterium]|nr:Na+:solute symporter [Gemmatimonadota bacterium]